LIESLIMVFEELKQEQRIWKRLRVICKMDEEI
jgi:hypothetical protein